MVMVMITGALLLRAAPSVAESACPEASTPQQARRLAGQAFDEGERLFGERRFREAIERFRCSYGLVQHPNTLYNIARSAQEAGDLTLTTYREYLERHATDADRATVERNISELDRRIAESRHPQNPAETLPVHVAARPEQPPPAVPTPAAAAAEPETSTRMTTARLVAWITMALGVALTATGGGLWIEAWSRAEDIPATVDTDDDLQHWSDVRDGGESMETASYILMGTGAAALVASIVLFAVAPGREPVTASTSRGPRLGLAAGDGMLGLTLAGSFEGP
jgi:hypothetical protein